MKTTVLIALLAATPMLFAAEPVTQNPADPVPKVAPSPEDVADQAALVQQLGQEASRGFDPEAHAHALRLQIEALLSAPTALKTPPATTTAPAPVPAVALPSNRTVDRPVAPVLSPTPVAAPAQSRDTAIREAFRKVRTVLDDLEVRLNESRKGE